MAHLNWKSSDCLKDASKLFLERPSHHLGLHDNAIAFGTLARDEISHSERLETNLSSFKNELGVA
jgi:hypothetical protein